MSIFTKLYPLDKLKTEMNSPAIIIYRLMAVPFIIIFKILNFHPNWITYISLLALFVAAIFSFNGEFIVGSLFILLSLVLDCADGIIARLNNKESELGLKLESIHADLALIIYPGSVIMGIIDKFSVSLNILFLLLISTSLYLKWRPIYSNSKVDDDPKNLSFLMKVIYSQQKPNVSIRSSSIIGKLLFFIRYNTATNMGIAYALIIIFPFFDEHLIIYPMYLMIYSQLFFSIAAIFGSLMKKSLE
tara:strand:- start:850 stop:1587 length:738 start_codon:yes stop_codon:yes gene_type:complete